MKIKYDFIINYDQDGNYICFCKLCNNNFTISNNVLNYRIHLNKTICTSCMPLYISSPEIEIANFLKEYNISYETKNRSICDPYELDFYLPDSKIALEFNGVYWHSDLYRNKDYHLNKTNMCLKKNIQLIHIWEDDWNHKKEIVKSIILNKLNKTPNKIYARKCQIKEINDNRIIRKFLNRNHIQGFVGSKIKLGLYYNNELVSLMTLGNLRKSLGQKSEIGSFELLRFCSILNTSVIGYMFFNRKFI